MDAGAAELTETRGHRLIEALPCFVFCGDKFAERRFVRLVHAEIVAVRMDCALDACREASTERRSTRPVVR